MSSSTSSPPPLPASSFADTANPFLVPKDDIFSLKAQEDAAKLAHKAHTASLKIWDKPKGGATALPTPSPSQPTSTYLQRVAARNAFLASSSSAVAHSSSSPSDPLHTSTADSHFYPSSLPHTEKLNMASFITQKRDMFLLHMSLATKRAEISKLEEKAAMKEDALRKAEVMLEEDAMRFDAFLKENDRRAHESLKRADRESKEKNERVVEIKKLNAEIGKVEADMSKYEEQLGNCIKYKTFLDHLTDPAWLEREERRREERMAERRKKKEDKRRAKLRQPAELAAPLASHRNARLTPPPHATRRDAAAGDRKGGDASSSSSSSTTQPAASESSSDSDSDTDVYEERMYFTSPQQLLELFAQLEERNLFLIQNVQETEESLEEMKAKYEEMETEMADKAAQLQANIEEMKKKIDKEREKTAQLHIKKQVMGIVGDIKGMVDAEKVVDSLREHVKAVYRKSGFDADTQTDTLDMLRDIEGWLAHLLNEMRSMDPAKVEAAEKRKNAERRTMIRQAKKEEQQRMYEERLAKSTARATAEVVRHSGKPVMFRSQPMKKKVKEQNVQQVDEEAEELKRYFT